jgi:hypothetical protein
MENPSTHLQSIKISKMFLQLFGLPHDISAPHDLSLRLQNLS